ncbi:hypothetical protein [Pectobacterium zantedeschiae]|uniref:Phage abortive infection protein n=1 Tax=Pectobacterium zantedeschiae TaxID=2034769 RepID=A0A9X8JEV1_9GAMM|nr:hypothetical protein [Pectobacterium zantedeschiae]RYC38901.1 hypothetical protein CLR69_21865 [Pectobacterium zantedeschiae]
MLKTLCLALIIVVWGLYSLNFGVSYLSTQGADVWGQFGDFMGGVLNPILSFISICLLIHSVRLQLQSNQALMHELKRQEKLENYKKFEMRFFSLIEAQESNFDKLRIAIDDAPHNNELQHENTPEETSLIQYKSGNAVTYIDDSLSLLVNGGIGKERICEWLEDLDVDEHFFSLARRFYLPLKLINDKVEENEREEQYELLINLTDEKLLTIIVILCSYFEWDNLNYIKNSKILKQANMDNYVSNYLK